MSTDTEHGRCVKFPKFRAAYERRIAKERRDAGEDEREEGERRPVLTLSSLSSSPNVDDLDDTSPPQAGRFGGLFFPQHHRHRRTRSVDSREPEPEPRVRYQRDDDFVMQRQRSRPRYETSSNGSSEHRAPIRVKPQPQRQPQPQPQTQPHAGIDPPAYVREHDLPIAIQTTCSRSCLPSHLRRLTPKRSSSDMAVRRCPSTCRLYLSALCLRLSERPLCLWPLVILIGVLVYLIMRHRRKQTLPSSSRIRNGYTQTRTTTADTYGSTYKQTPDISTAGTSTTPRSATSPPPFLQRDSILGQPIRPRAERDTPVENPASKTRQYVPPVLTLWASIWPTESGWAGPGGVASIRDEDFGELVESSSSEDGNEKTRPSMDADRESQYALNARPTEHTFGPFKLSPTLFGTTKHKHPEVDSVLGQPTVTVTSPLSPQPLFHSPRLEDGDENEAVELTCLMDDTDRFERSAMGNFTLAFGPHDPLARVRGPPNQKGTVEPRPRSRSRSLDEASRPVSTISGQILSVLTGRLATPLFRSVELLRKVGAAVEEWVRLAQGDESRSGSASPVHSTPVRRLPALPDSHQIPAVPPIPRHHLTAPGEIRPWPVPMSQSPPLVPDTRAGPRSASLGPDQIPPIPLPDPPSTGPARSASETGAAARPRPASSIGELCASRQCPASAVFGTQTDRYMGDTGYGWSEAQE
ncbi:hypothetical protein FRC06_009879, partial [Ceratobasidium sp. 370]